MRVLIVKTSSIGDIIHTLPALTDAHRALPQARFDWLVERDLAPICTWHPAVERVLTVSYRYWRWRPITGVLGGHLAAIRTELRAQSYDAVIDAQGLYKSALMTAMVRGPKHGFDLASCREKLAPLAYDHHYRIPSDWNAVARLRHLFSRALGYALPEGAPDYGLDGSRFGASDHREPYLVFLHGSAWRTKLWPVERWRSLAERAQRAGFTVCVPWFRRLERVRAEAIGRGLDGVEILPPTDLDDMARLLVNATGVVAVDTGFAHLATGFAVPKVSLYGPTRFAHAYPCGRQLGAGLPCAPCRNKICNLTGNVHAEAPCLAAISAARVWRELSSLLAEPRQDAADAGGDVRRLFAQG